MKHSPNIQILQVVSRLPKNMLKIHGTENVSEFVLHELSGKECFNLSKAAYFVENPAFDCMKGVVGFAQDEAYPISKSIWDEPQRFSEHMQQAVFNQQVRRSLKRSCKNCAHSDKVVLDELASNLGIDSYNYCTWQMKHDNHGYFLYQVHDDELDPEMLLNGLHLLSFCPIF